MTIHPVARWRELGEPRVFGAQLPRWSRMVYRRVKVVRRNKIRVSHKIEFVSARMKSSFRESIALSRSETGCRNGPTMKLGVLFLKAYHPACP